MPEQCVFCEIIQKNLPASIVHEDNSVICFLPQNMEVVGHTLIAPKAHFKDIYEAPEGTLLELINTTKKLALYYRRKSNQQGSTFFTLVAKAPNSQYFIFTFIFYHGLIMTRLMLGQIFLK